MGELGGTSVREGESVGERERVWERGRERDKERLGWFSVSKRTGKKIFVSRRFHSDEKEREKRK